MKFRNILILALFILGGQQLTYAQASCPSYGSATPPPPYDPCVQAVFDADPFCCNNTWDALCQGAYDPTPCSGGINMTNGSTNTCSATFFDSGGSGGSYNNNENFVYTICPSNPGEVIQAAFTVFDIESGFDNFTVYDGPTTGSPIIGTYTGTTGPGTIAATLANGGCLTFQFTSDGSITDIGWEAAISCIPAGGGGPCSNCANPTAIATLPFNTTTSSCGTCNDYSSADACASTYMDGEDYVFSYTPATAEYIDVSLTGTSTYTAVFITQGCPDAGGACVGSSTSTAGDPSIANVSLLAGLTYYITVSTEPPITCTDFTINVTQSAPTCSDNLQNGGEIGIDCGGPCPPCPPPTPASDCNGAINICTDANFAIDPNGFGAIDELTGNNISNPSTNPSSGNSGCLLSGELNSTWMVINVASPGTLEFSFGAAGGTNFYDWAMWAYDPNTCTNIINNIQPPVACNWNAAANSFTGMANPVPPGGTAGNFEPPLTVNAGDQFVISFSNFSSALTNVPLNFFGTANISCTTFNPTYVNNATICEGQCANLVATGATSYVWTADPALSTTVGPNVTVCPTAGPGNYSYDVTGTAPTGTGVATATVVVLPASDPACVTLLNTELVEFAARLDQELQLVRLNWETATELNSSHFIIQRSSNGIDFETIAEAPAAGYSEEPRYYHAEDYKPLNGISYYRLQLVNLSGSVLHSEVISIQNHQHETSNIVVAPNPAKEEFSIQGEGLEDAQVIIYNSLGQILDLQASVRQSNRIGFNSQQLSSGLYWIVVHQNGRAVSRRLVIQ